MVFKSLFFIVIVQGSELVVCKCISLFEFLLSFWLFFPFPVSGRKQCILGTWYSPLNQVKYYIPSSREKKINLCWFWFTCD